MLLSESLGNMAKCQCNTGLRALAQKTEQLETVVEQLETAAREALETLNRLSAYVGQGESCSEAAKLQAALDALYEFAGSIDNSR